MNKLIIKLLYFIKGQSLALLQREETLVLGVFNKAKAKLEILAEKQAEHLSDVTAKLDSLAKEQVALIEAKAKTTNTITKLDNFVS